MAVNVADVRLIFETDLEDDAVQAAITDAGLLAEKCIESLAQTRQDAIVKYLAAHLLSVGPSSGGGGALSSQKLGDASESYSVGHLGDQLRSTSYGMTAIQLDPNGCLVRIGKAKATIEQV